MRSFIILSFLVMGLVYWEVSGGADFQPEAWPETMAMAETGGSAASAPVAVEPVVAEAVTRADTSPGDLVDLAPVAAPALPAGALSSEPLSPGDALAAVAPDLAAAPPPELETESVTLASSDGGDLRRVAGDLVNVREGPGTDFGVVAQLTAGEMAEVIEADGQWVRVRAQDGAEGWMAARFLEASGL